MKLFWMLKRYVLLVVTIFSSISYYMLYREVVSALNNKGLNSVSLVYGVDDFITETYLFVTPIIFVLYLMFGAPKRFWILLMSGITFFLIPNLLFLILISGTSATDFLLLMPLVSIISFGLKLAISKKETM